MRVHDAALALVSSTADLSLTHCTYTLQFCRAALNKTLTPFVYSIADYSFILSWGEDLHSCYIQHVTDPHTEPRPIGTALADDTVKDMALTLALLAKTLEINHGL
jgi:hypothetical protein